MPDIRLRRTNHQRPRTPRGIPQHHSQRRSLDRITQRRPGSVQFHVTDLARRHTRTLTRKPQHPGLTLHPRSRQTITTTIIVDRTTRDHTHHIITISDRILQPLQNNKTPTLTPHITIRPTIENKRTPIRRQPTELRHRHRRLRRQHQIHPTRQRQRHLTTTQRLTRLMHRHQRRRLTRIHHQRRTRQTQQKRHPIRDHTPRKTRRRESTNPLHTTPTRQNRIIIRHRPNKNTRSGPTYRTRHHTSVLERLPRQLQHQPLLRIHRHSLTRRNTEKPRVKTINPTQEPRTPSHRLPRHR
ncbi:hypothetical protein, partial [Streptomyces sp. SID7909]|uniref:hypothetical protein n=1 Tax=Streptomyces sp. SID7909 TaxID=2706092 RepID=UPI001EF25F52